MGCIYEEYEEVIGKGFQCACGKYHDVPIRRVLIEKGASGKTAEVLRQLGYHKKLQMVMDINTWQAAGESINAHLLQNGYEVGITRFENRELVADESALNRLMCEIEAGTECLVAVGSGTLNDLTRYAAFKQGKPYVVIATAPSMDGYASSVSPLIMNGFKNTYSAAAPEAIIGDLEVICNAPGRMVAAGFGDLIGKVICQNDWKLGYILNGEYYCEYVSRLIYKAVDVCLSNAGGLKRKEPEAIEALMHGLVLSGIGMLMVGNSRPASGCEHHLSHFWEMRFMQEGREPALHGEKVGVSSILMARIYNELKGIEDQQVKAMLENRTPQTREEIVGKIRQSYGALTEEVLRENFAGGGETADPDRIFKKWEEVRQVLEKVPAAQEIANILKAADAHIESESLGIDAEMTREGLENCMYVRNRYTVLRLADELGLLEQTIKALQI